MKESSLCLLFPESERPAGLEHQKASGSSRTSTLYIKAFKQYRTWQKECINPFTEGTFADDLKGMKPHLAQFKDGDKIRKLVVQVVCRTETIKKSHQQSGHHSSGDKRLEEICSSFLSLNGKNVDIPFFYAFLMLDTVALTFVSRKLQDGAGASTGFGTVGGVRVVLETKKSKQVDVSSEIKKLTKNIAEQAEKITSNTNDAITKLFSPFSPLHTSFG
jgi:hypothetical protein